jgi:cytochrome c peroxidase
MLKEALGVCVFAASMSACVRADEQRDTAIDEQCRRELHLDDSACKQVLALRMADALPPARDNPFADDPAATSLGFRLFFDSRWSTTNMSCGTCHQPEAAFGDAKPVAVGAASRPLTRNSPSVLIAAFNPGAYMWDGRARSLSEQPLLALENPDEMNITRLALAHGVYDRPSYRIPYEAIFGPLPDLSDTQRFPLQGKPGDSSFDAMSEADRASVDEVMHNIGRALEAYMRKIAVGPSPLDIYLQGDTSALSASAKRGLELFVNAGCIRCHSGPSLSDGDYHDMAVPSADGAAPDLGRGDGTFRTPGLRQVASTGPWGHNGHYTQLRALIEAHGEVRLEPADVAAVQAFLLALTGTLPDRPWGNWPGN